MRGIEEDRMPHTRHSLMLITSDNVVVDRLERLIKSNGYGLTLATTVPQALIDVRRSLPALILADRQLIEQGRLRRDQLPASIPVRKAGRPRSANSSRKPMCARSNGSAR